MKDKFSGFTLVELVLVLVIIALLSAVAVPKYIEVNGERTGYEKRELATKVKNALVIARADIKHAPSVQDLVAYVQSNYVSAADTGIVFKKSGVVYTVPTYSDSGCTSLTKMANEKVECVGDPF